MGSSREMEVVGGKLFLRPSKGAGGGRLAGRGGERGAMGMVRRLRRKGNKD